MKAILKKYNIVEKLLLLSLLTLISKPIIGQLLYSDSYATINIHKKNSPLSVFKSVDTGDLDNTEYIEEVEELLEDDETVHPNSNEKTSFYLPTSKIVDEIIIYSYQCSFYKTFTKPRYYITYSCLRSYLS
jgi:hypothetical protein